MFERLLVNLYGFPGAKYDVGKASSAEVEIPCAREPQNVTKVA